MSEKTFEAKGIFLLNKKENAFAKTVTAINENFAKEKILSKIGSDHKIKRHKIKINEIKEITQ